MRLMPSALVLALLATPAAPPPPVGFWSSLSRLRMSGRLAALGSGQVELRLAQDAGRVHFETLGSARFLGIGVARSRTRSILDAATGRAIELVSLTPKGGRRYTFGATGYTVQKLKPVHGWDAPVEEWQATEQRQFDYPVLADGESRAPVFDSYGMLLELRRLPLAAPGDEATLWIATSKGPRAYRIRVAGERTRSRRYQDLRTGERRTVESRELLLVTQPEGEDLEAAGLLNLKGNVEIWAEAGTKTLLEVSGKVPKLPGRATIELRGFEDRAAPR